MAREETIYTDRARKLTRWAATLLVAAAGALPSAAGVAAVYVLRLPVQAHLYVLLSAAALTVATWTVAVARAPLLGNRKLRRQLWQKIAREPEGAEFLENAFFVGIAPTEELVHWSGDTDWDVGFLKTVGDVLAFWGDRCRWSLPRQAVVAVSIARRPDVPRAVVRWSAGDLGGVVTITSREGPTVADAAARTAEIQASLQAWLAQSNGRDGPNWGWPPTEIDAPGARPLAPSGMTGCIGGLAAFAIAVTTCLLVALPAYTAGLKALAAMEAVAVGWPLLLIISELAVSGA